MTDSRKFNWLTLATVVSILWLGGSVRGVEMAESYFDQGVQQFKFELSSANTDDEFEQSTPAGDDHSVVKKKHRKSPFKAFALSAAVPGLGQYYYGSKLKSAGFLAVEATAWILYFKFHNEADDATDFYEAYNNKYWHRDRYEQYIFWVYDGATSDAGITGLHHLPDQQTQQYFEMTGKYDQFAWGWDDAMLSDGRVWGDFTGPANPPPLITSASETIPYSSMRLYYEELRHDANVKYGRATKMIIVSMVNRLISAFEAYFMVKRQNNKIPDEDDPFSRFSVHADVKSYTDIYDTPWLSFGYRF